MIFFLKVTHVFHTDFVFTFPLNLFISNNEFIRINSISKKFDYKGVADTLVKVYF